MHTHSRLYPASPYCYRTPEASRCAPWLALSGRQKVYLEINITDPLRKANESNNMSFFEGAHIEKNERIISLLNEKPVISRASFSSYRWSDNRHPDSTLLIFCLSNDIQDQWFSPAPPWAAPAGQRCWRPTCQFLSRSILSKSLQALNKYLPTWTRWHFLVVKIILSVVWFSLHDSVLLKAVLLYSVTNKTRARLWTNLKFNKMLQGFKNHRYITIPKE